MGKKVDGHKKRKIYIYKEREGKVKIKRERVLGVRQ